MLPRVGNGEILDEEKDPFMKVVNQPRPLPLRLLQLFLIFLGVGIVCSIFSMYMIRDTANHDVLLVRQSKIEACDQQPSSLEGWIRPPFRLWHSMNDTELFWRSTFEPRIKDYPFKRTPKIAFMFLTRGPLPMAPLWEKFFKGHEALYSIYIHSLPSYRPDYPPDSVFYGRNIPSQMVEWGLISMVDAERRLLANALLDLSNEWFVLLSEACIPVYNFSIVYRYISRSRYSFVGSYDDPGGNGRGRYNRNMSPQINITEWRKGSQWFEVNRKLALDIVADDLYYPVFNQFCKPACYVDEHYFPTMLSIQSPNLLANRSLTWVDWSRGGPHPATFGKADVTQEFFKKISEGETCIYNDQPSSLCYVFARKFSPNALDVLLEQSSNLFGF